MRWRRRDRLPDEARADLGLRRGERVLAAAALADGGWVAATDEALVGPGLRISWTGVAHAQWLDEPGVLVLDPVLDSFPPQRLALIAPGRVPETVHERVVASIVVTRRLSVPGAGGLRVAGRRSGREPVEWQVVPDPGVDGEDPAVRDAADAMVRRLREELGE